MLYYVYHKVALLTFERVPLWIQQKHKVYWSKACCISSQFLYFYFIYYSYIYLYKLHNEIFVTMCEQFSNS